LPGTSVRRGKLVEIPAAWVGKIPTEQTLRKRDSKLTNKLARETKWRRGKGHPDANKRRATGSEYIAYQDAKVQGIEDPEVSPMHQATL
jgi:hypothetical protein